MKILFVSFLLFLSAISMAKEITIPNTTITFTSPEGFNSLPQEIIDLKWPHNQAPKWVIGNDNASTTIAFDLKTHNISNTPLTKLKDSFTNTFERIIPGLKWKKSEIIELAGKKWIYLEMTSYAIDTDIYNMMLVTSYKNKMLIFNFNSTKEDFLVYEKVLRKSIETIKFL